MLEHNIVEADQTNLSEESYQEYWEIINEASSKFPYIKEILNKAMRETIELIEKDIYVDNSDAITPIGWVAGTFAEVSSYCNEISLRIYDKQQKEIDVEELDFNDIEDF